ncbi:MAG TPA: tRNA (adenosine(37)-N6)-threonylcarbamoyltransferase complex ATPase subunit type 1 TsaE [Flavisolibacter sp.]|nr:tRNA (adenosine(37)-N6)-threonylcarbamoyltransferase complex ATPase subunit type 1 TsaE [Flavisolibacter sp.]
MKFHVTKDGLDVFATSFWKYVKDAKVFAFHGAMGAGKTTIIESLCKAKGVKDVMGSPTFSIINEYSYDENGVENIIYHIDLYRLKDEQEIIQAGVEDCIYSGAVCFVEWPEKAPFLFDDKTVQVYLEAINEEEREVKIDMPSLV